MCRSRMPASRMSGSPNFLQPPVAPSKNRLPHSPALPVASAIPDPAIPSRLPSSSFTLKEIRR